MRIKLLAALLVAASFVSASAPSVALGAAQEAGAGDALPDDGFRQFVASIRSQAIGAGVRPGTFDAVAATLTLNPRVVALDRAQPGGPATNAPSAFIAFAPYRAKHVNANLIALGRRRYADLAPRLRAIEARTGVPEEIAMAIYGHETGYGTYVGDFDLLRSLATLAYDGRRRALFTSEFIACLKLLDEGVPRGRLVGSWAGATGYPQFLPSMVLKVAIDGDGDGRRDIWTNETDALASIGNYLSLAGWKAGVPWGVAVRVPADADRGGIATRLVSPRCPRVLARQSRWLTIAEWRARGLQFVGSRVPRETEMAALIEPDGPNATAYLLTSNYRVILDYNCSNFYALSVGLLADAIRN